MTRVHANRDACVGSGMCVYISEKYFALKDDPAIVEILQEDVEDADRETVEEAVDACPAQVLYLREN